MPLILWQIVASLGALVALNWLMSRSHARGLSGQLAPSGRTWGEVAALPDGWDGAGNSVWVDPGCGWVAEGTAFLPVTTLGVPWVDSSRPAAMTLLGTLQTGSTAWVHIDHLLSLGLDRVQVADALLREIAPMCWAVGPGQWGPGVVAWRADLVARIGLREEGGA